MMLQNTTGGIMRWDHATRYQILLKINNAVISKTSRLAFFEALSTELKKHFSYDRISINLYDEGSQSLKYFATAVGIKPKGLSSMEERPLAKGAIAKMAIESRQAIIIDDLTRYSDLTSIGSLVKAGLTSTLAFPLIVRDRILGTLHFSFIKPPNNLSELSELLAEVSKQVAIAVDNMAEYNYLRNEKKSLEREKKFLLKVSEEYRPENFYYASPAMTEIIDLIKRLADIDAPILITGETGTGKDFLTRYIHSLSVRKEHMLVKVNCPALSATLFESELFGHAKGAFTGADARREGRFELAEKGTIFLDEFVELPDSLQAKLLQVLQECRFERVGDSRPIEINFRVIAATNRDIEVSLREGKLRKDLYYRLNIVRIHVPPLRERLDDIPYLIEHINSDEASQINREKPVYTSRAIESLMQYTWPGNVRELKNLVKRMVIMKPGENITGAEIKKILDLDQSADNPAPGRLPTLAEAEKECLEQALRKSRGVLSGKRGAAHLLDVPRSTLQYRLRKYDLNPKNYL
jgi:formate hydrogenlyase transcriptional activator